MDVDSGFSCDLSGRSQTENPTAKVNITMRRYLSAGLKKKLMKYTIKMIMETKIA